MKQYVIIGGGVAAVGCIEGIRQMDRQTPITVISKEKHPVYCRPLISYYLEGKTDLEKISYRPADFYSDNGCTVLYGKTAVRIDPEQHSVTLDDGSKISYTELCVATGSTPFVPPTEGLQTVENRFSFLSLDDALQLEKAIQKDSRVLIIGAGLIGLKCAEGLKDRVAEITVCDLADRILSSILDCDTAPVVQKHLEENGIKFLLGDSVAAFEKNTAVLKSGKKIEFDVLVTAVGVRANTALVADAGGTVNRGIAVNDSMQTDLSDIYSAGDCSEGMDISFGQKRILALWPNAYIQGRTAGINMAGGDAVFDKAIPMNSIGFFGLHIMTAGSYITEENGGRVFTEEGSGAVKKFFVQDGLLKGYILVGKVQNGGIYTSLIREKTPLDTINFDLVRKNPSFAAFSKENRRKKFGGVV